MQITKINEEKKKELDSVMNRVMTQNTTLLSECNSLRKERIFI
jgi:hypothetical protein